MADLESVLVIGSGPIVIGQAAEFDYAGTQACKALREEGVRSILVNSNPATIMTDEGIADRVYIEPITRDVLARVIEQERPQGLLASMGGQTGLNMAVELGEAGILDAWDVRVLGTPLEGIQDAEDRERFRALMERIGEPVPESRTVTSLPDAWDFARSCGFPLVVRPAYTLGGTGGGFARHEDEFEAVVNGGLQASPIGQVLVERSLAGWKEIEYEVMRDGADNCITVCNMENFDPMGVHTGDSIVFAPSQTLSDKEYQMLRSAALRIIRALRVEGGCNVQFALDTKSFNYAVIEVNPRVSRSSALASKATGYPIARIAAKIALGRRLDELPNPITQRTCAAFEPALDYVVTKIPRWPFDKFEHADRRLGTQMKATGEVMAIERTIEACLNKAVRGLEIGGRTLLWEDPAWADDDEAIWWRIDHAHDERLWAIMAALRRGAEPAEIARRSHIDIFFVDKMAGIHAMERRLLHEPLTADLLWDAKRMGFSDEMIAALADELPQRVRERRESYGITPVYKMVDTCAAEFDAVTPYYWSTYEHENEAQPEADSPAVVIGSGPIRIGQGIEFDYCSVHAAWALQAAGRASVMINSNPETVSTDFDSSTRLYFEALDVESVADVLANEGRRNGMPPAIAQFGGQTAINLAEPLYTLGHEIAGGGPGSIDEAEDRAKFDRFLERLGLLRPPGATVTRMQDAVTVAEQLGYPVLVRPSYVLGGRAMEIVDDRQELERYIHEVTQPSPERPVLVDKYLEGRELEVDAICDGTHTLIPGIMEHIERAGVHSGDSFAVYPPVTASEATQAAILEATQRICAGLGARGLVNVQYVEYDGDVYVLEVNPRSSRTVPFLSKATGIPMVRLAMQTLFGATLAELGWEPGLATVPPLFAVKAPVFSMAKLSGVDTYLGPEMKSTGEVMGVDRAFPPALLKAMIAAGNALPPEGDVLLSIADRDKPGAVDIIRRLDQLGYGLVATEGTARFIRDLGFRARTVAKLRAGTPNVEQFIRSGSSVLVVNTLTGRRQALQDGHYMRRAAAETRTPCLTTLETVRSLLDALDTTRGAYDVRTIDEYRGAAPIPA
ncbi:MAG: carbamoyl-phosphate synthase large subunit [Chloroflexi bacterium]|nr:carbamoyl-phosphate synthase large subunit [Chloroflexota bacterium]